VAAHDLDPESVNESQPPPSEVPPAAAAADGGPSLAFWAVGIVLNLALVAAYFAWAWRQRNKRDRDD